jgi:putative Mg2+ transporter-C (MgtC) family protein
MHFSRKRCCDVAWEAILRLFLAMIMGGLIGLEREIVNRPAGFRTHTLVCMGSALVMTTSEYIFQSNYDLVNLDPARLGAQVISGIGFLGAGTIMNDGHRVRGLTTAASLWVVACIGLAVGAGFYEGAIAGFIMSYITLIFLKKLEKIFEKRVGNIEISLFIRNVPGQIAKVADVIGRFKIQIRDIRIQEQDEDYINVKFLLSLPPTMTKESIIAELERMEGVKIDRED